MFTKRTIPMALAAGFCAVCGVGAAEQGAPSTSVFPVPPTPTEKPAEVVTQPFQPAVRVPRPLPVNPLAAVSALTNLVFDAEVKEEKAPPDVYDVKFTFAVTNVSARNVVIQAVRPSCGCTVAQVPDLPWTLEPGARGEFGINMDLRGKRGSLTKSIAIITDQGNKTVYVRGILPDPATMTDDQRQRNMMIAKADRQAVFKGECASCHATPAFGKTGSQLYEAACGICHEGGHRNEMVPDLSIARPGRDYEYWRKWIAEGKEGSLMPAFSKAHEGPLTDAQIMSLAHFLTRKHTPVVIPPTQPAVNQ